MFRENRYILFLTENYAALDILKNPEYLSLSKDTGTSSDSQSYQPFILFGSSFPKDKDYTQVFGKEFNESFIKKMMNYCRFAEILTRLRSAWKLEEQLFCLIWKICMRVCMMC